MKVTNLNLPKKLEKVTMATSKNGRYDKLRYLVEHKYLQIYNEF